MESRGKDDVSRRLQASDQWGVTVNVVERVDCSPLWRVANNSKLLVMCKTILNSIENMISRRFFCKYVNFAFV